MIGEILNYMNTTCALLSSQEMKERVIKFILENIEVQCGVLMDTQINDKQLVYTFNLWYNSKSYILEQDRLSKEFRLGA